MFKITTRKRQDAVDIAASAQTFKDKVRQGIESRFASSLREGETLPDFSFAQDLVDRLLRDLASEGAAAESSQTSELVDISYLRTRRDQLASELRIHLRDLRHVLDDLLAPNVAAAILNVRRFSNMKPVTLAHTAHRALVALRDPELGLQERARAGIGLALKPILEQIENCSTALESLLEEISQQTRTGEGELRGKIEIHETITETTQRCSDFLYGLYRLAGLDYHAKRLGPRPRVR